MSGCVIECVVSSWLVVEKEDQEEDDDEHHEVTVDDDEHDDDDDCEEEGRGGGKARAKDPHVPSRAQQTLSSWSMKSQSS